MRYLHILFALALMCVPSVGFAAGFATQSLFLSKDSVTEGESVLIYAVVSNNTTTTFTGKLQVHEGSTLVGTVPVSLAAGSADTVSVSWKPAAGKHAITAQLLDSAGTIAGEESATFSVAAKKESSSETTPLTIPPKTEIESSDNIQDSIENLSPVLAAGTGPIFSVIDAGRTHAAKALDNGVSWSKKQLATSKTVGKVLGNEENTDSNKSAGDRFFSTIWLIVATLALYLFSVLRYVTGSAGAFYPLFAVLFFFVLWKLYRRFRRRY